MGFADDVKRWEAKALAQMDASMCKAVGMLFTYEVTLAPDRPAAQFSKGLLKNSFFPQAGGGFDTTVGSVADSSGMASLTRIKVLLATKPFLGRDNTVTLTNSISYSYRADKIGWPMGEGANGWVWSGRVKAYGFTSQAVNNFKGAYS